MKNQNSSSAKMAQSNSLMWIKRSGYSRKNIQHSSSLKQNDLMWVKVDGNNQSGFGMMIMLLGSLLLFSLFNF